jgi:hypothetical protein
MDGFWQFIAQRGIEPNPFRAGFLQLVAVADTDAQAEKLYEKHIRISTNLCIFPRVLLPARASRLPQPENSIRKDCSRAI